MMRTRSSHRFDEQGVEDKIGPACVRHGHEADDMSGPFVITDPLPMPPQLSDMSY